MDFCLSVKTSFFLYLVFLLNSKLLAQRQQLDPRYDEENLRQVALDLEKDLTTLVTNASGATTRNPNISKHYATIVHNATREAEKLRTNVQTILDEAASILAETKTILERTNATTTTGEVPYHDASANLTLGDDLEGTSVNFSISAVKAPVDVVMSSDEVKSALRWSDVALTTTTNFSESTTTTFRYFGSRHGFVRVHPGASWLANSPSFDASFEDWYVDGSVLSMDLILLVDASGTMFGLAKKIVEQTVKVLLDLLRAKDRVAAQSFARRPSTLGCSRYLVRPTDDVKAALNDDVSRIYTKGISQYESAFALASELFANSSALGSSQKVVVLLTDGAYVRNKTFYRIWNTLNTDVRVFTFIVGVPTKDVGSAKLISCENSGYYLRIRSVAAIRQATRDFVAVMGRSAAYHWPGGERAVITRSDVGYFIREPVIRLSLPVVRSEEVLGVVGVQVPLREFRRVMPWSWTTSIDVVIADEHGQIIYRQRSSLPDLPDSFVAEMATMQTGRQIVSYRINDLGRVSLQYDYAPLSNWPLSVAIATLPETSRTFAMRRHSTVEDFPEVKAHLDNRRCSSSSNRSDILQNLVDNLTADRCGNEVIEQIISDADLAFGVYRAWTTTRDENVCSNFISTQAGVTLYSNRECDIVAHSNDWLSSFDVAVSVESDDSVKTISKLRFDNATFALIGTKFNGTVFKKIVRSAAEKLKATSTFLIDSLGYVISDSTNSSSSSSPPRFFGHVQPHVVHDAIARGVVTNETAVVKSINRGQCAGETSSSNSAFRSTFLGPIFALKAYLVSVVYNLISLGLFFDVRTVLGLSSTSSGGGGDDDVAEYCYIEYAHYFVDLQNDSVSCSTPAECELNYCLIRLGQTNLYLAAVWGDGRDCPNVYALPEKRAVPSSSRSRCLEEKRDVYSAQIPVNLTAQKESNFLCSGCRAQGSCVALLLLVVPLLSYL